MGKNLGLVFFDLFVHVLGGDDCNHYEEESDNAEGSQEVELAFDKADHGLTAFAIEAAVGITLIRNKEA